MKVVFALSFLVLSPIHFGIFADKILMAKDKHDLEMLTTDILVNSLKPFKCVVIICDEVYYPILTQSLFAEFEMFISFIIIFVEDAEDLMAPYDETVESLNMANTEGCQFYIIFIANGIQVGRLLMFGDRYRILNTRANYLMLWDYRLFHKDLHYLWKRIVNVVFIREYGGIKQIGTVRKVIPWFEITTVPFPAPIKGILVPRRLDTWRQSKFRTGADLFRDKTTDLKNQTLKVVTFPHIPATTRTEVPDHKTVRTFMPIGKSMGYSGIEIEILRTISDAMNFIPEIYEPLNADTEMWGEKQPDGQYSGLIGEMIKSHADIALGDLHYNAYYLKIMDLTIPYNTECLTFLTPESLTNNSWYTLIAPFKPFMWAAILTFLFLTGFIFYGLSKFHDEINGIMFKDLKDMKQALKRKIGFPHSKGANVHVGLSSHKKYILMKKQYELPRIEGEPEGLYLFGELSNSILYTYGILLMVSLPKLPTGWSIRMLTGWYWLYCTLVVVAYKASMTAILANPAPRVTIDTLQELVDSKLPCGGWGEINREFFKSSIDPTSQIIGIKFETVNDSETAIKQISNGKFAFYENVHFLKEASIKTQLKYQLQPSYLYSNQNSTMEMGEMGDHNLHIMSDCVIHMPISIGLQKNSPIKPLVNKFIRRVFEAGLIRKWLDDVMQSTLNAEIHYRTEESTKALMNIEKLFGGLVALFVGYIISILALFTEIIYYECFTKKHPHFNKYSKQISKVPSSR